jgi:hypothetical protein
MSGFTVSTKMHSFNQDGIVIGFELRSKNGNEVGWDLLLRAQPETARFNSIYDGIEVPRTV